MSVFRLDIEMNFKAEDDMVSFLNLLEKMNDKLADIKGGQLPINQKVRYHECNHDTGGACGGYVNVEITGEAVHKTKLGDVKDAETVIPETAKVNIKAAVQKQKEDLAKALDTMTAERNDLKAENEQLKAV